MNPLAIGQPWVIWGSRESNIDLLPNSLCFLFYRVNPCNSHICIIQRLSSPFLGVNGRPGAIWFHRCQTLFYEKCISTMNYVTQHIHINHTYMHRHQTLYYSWYWVIDHHVLILEHRGQIFIFTYMQYLETLYHLFWIGV